MSWRACRTTSGWWVGRGIDGAPSYDPRGVAADFDVTQLRTIFVDEDEMICTVDGRNAAVERERMRGAADTPDDGIELARELLDWVTNLAVEAGLERARDPGTPFADARRYVEDAIHLTRARAERAEARGQRLARRLASVLSDARRGDTLPCAWVTPCSDDPRACGAHLCEGHVLSCPYRVGDLREIPGYDRPKPSRSRSGAHPCEDYRPPSDTRVDELAALDARIDGLRRALAFYADVENLVDADGRGTHSAIDADRGAKTRSQIEFDDDLTKEVT